MVVKDLLTATEKDLKMFVFRSIIRVLFTVWLLSAILFVCIEGTDGVPLGSFAVPAVLLVFKALVWYVQRGEYDGATK